VCLDGARAAQESILADFTDADISVSIVWIDMLEGDTQASAERSAQLINDSRVCHFYDSERIVGKAIAQRLGGNGKAAWDIYLFYAPGSEWTENPPMPIEWMHQLLGSSWADSAHLRRGNDLVAALHNCMAKLMSARHVYPQF
jgi:hypothetical protein